MSWYKQSGGFAGKLESITFESKEWKDGKKPYHTLTMVLDIDQDGREDTLKQYLPAGFFYPNDGQSISEDGTTLEGGAAIGKDTEAFRFIQSAVDAGIVSEEELGDGSNFEMLTGRRYDYGREINKPRQMAAGRKALKIKDSNGFVGGGKTYTEDDIMKAGRQQDKNDKSKSYNHTFLVIMGALGAAAEAAPAPKAAKNAEKKAPASKDAKGGKANGAAKGKEAKGPSAEELATSMLVDFLADAKNNELKVSALSSLVVRKAVEDDIDNETRDAIRILLKDADFLGKEEGWSFDADAKTVAQA